MRIAFIILSLTAIALGVIRLRTAETICRNQMLTLRNYYELEVPRQLQAQEVELSYLTSPREVQHRAEEMALNLVEKDKRTGLAKTELPKEMRQR